MAVVEIVHKLPVAEAAAAILPVKRLRWLTCPLPRIRDGFRIDRYEAFGMEGH